MKREARRATVTVVRMVISSPSSEQVQEHVQDDTHHSAMSTEIITTDTMDHGAMEHEHGTFPQASVREILNQERQGGGLDRQMPT